MASSTPVSPARIAATASLIGVSTPSRRASWRTAGAEATPSATESLPASACVQALAAPQRQADAHVARLRAGAGEHQVAEAAEAGDRLGLAAQRHGQPGQLGEAARHQRGVGAAAEAAALDDAAGDRQHVLDRPAGFRADHVAADVGAEGRRGERLGERPGQRLVRCRQRDGGRQAARHLRRRSWGRTAPPAWRPRRLSASTCVISFSEPCSMPLAQSTTGMPSRACGANSRSTGAQMLRRRGGQHEVDAAEVGEVGRSRATAASSATPGRKRRFSCAALMLVHHLGLARPEQRLQPGARRRPGPAPCPRRRRRSRPTVLMPWPPCGRGRGSGWRAPRPRPAASAAAPPRPGRRPGPAASRSAPASAIIAALSVQYFSGGAAKRKAVGLGRCLQPTAHGARWPRRRRRRRSDAALLLRTSAHAAAHAAQHRAASRARNGRPVAARWRSARRRRDRGARRRSSAPSASRAAAVFRPENEKSQPSPAQQRARQREALRSRRPPPAAPAPGRRDRAGPAPWRSCRRPRRPHRRWSSPAGGSCPIPATSSSWQ